MPSCPPLPPPPSEHSAAHAGQSFISGFEFEVWDTSLLLGLWIAIAFILNHLIARSLHGRLKLESRRGFDQTSMSLGIEPQSLISSLPASETVHMPLRSKSSQHLFSKNSGKESEHGDLLISYWHACAIVLWVWSASDLHQSTQTLQAAL